MLVHLRFNSLESKRFPISLLLGVDVGGTKIALALGDETGNLVARMRRPTEPSGRPEDDLARIADDARRLLAEAGVATSEVSALGLSVPGPMDAEGGFRIHPPNLPGWESVPVGARLSQALGLPARIENDANAAALAEWRFGAGRGFEDVVYLTMSTGVGGGIIAGGRLQRGRGWGAGEIGHAPVEWDGELCACGMRGCLEAYVGGAAWTRRLRAVAPASSRAVAIAGGKDRVTPEHVVAAAREGDAFATSELDRFNHYLARGIVSAVFTLAPDVVILGTIPSAAGEELCFAPLRRRVKAQLWPVFAQHLRILPAALGDELPYKAGLCAAIEGLASAA